MKAPGAIILEDIISSFLFRFGMLRPGELSSFSSYIRSQKNVRRFRDFSRRRFLAILKFLINFDRKIYTRYQKVSRLRDLVIDF